MLDHLNKVPAKPARVVILGSAGFVSSAAKRRLEALDVSVLALPREELDLMSADAVAHLADMLRPNDALLFVAAKAPVKNNEMLIDNLRMGKTVCEALTKTPVGHVVYISSDAVYADSRNPITEKSCAQPGSLHGIMHLAREIMLTNAWNGPLCILRPTLIYGTGDPHNGYGPNRFLRLASAGENITLFGEGEELRDHVWVENVAEIVNRVLFRKSIGVLNIATGDVISFREIAEQTVKMFPYSSSEIRTSPRSGPMPHGGYRAFDATSTHEAFPDFRYTALRDGLLKVTMRE
jgi:nucleoside-diphosphate-sugar epimerase